MKRRQLTSYIEKDLQRKMVFLAGPRQCGKTTLAHSILEHSQGTYYNWDISADRKTLLNHEMNAHTPLWVFDELHKYRRWRNWLKGVYDEFHSDHSILVTGSAKLDVYNRGGDSLQGRYYFHRLHPFTYSELLGISPLDSIEKVPLISKNSSPSKDLKDLLKLGGFPEPLFSGSDREAHRWRNAYGARLIREEIRSLENLKELDSMELLFDQLSTTVGSVLSINSLREDLEVAFNTVKSWLRIFEQTYATFRLSPYGPQKLKAVKKEQKLYFWDWSRVEDEAARFENMIAVHLMRFVHWAEDVEGIPLELRYFRSTTGHEVDFVLLKKRTPWIAIEVKLSEHSISPSLNYFVQRTAIPHAFQVTLNGEKDFISKKIPHCPIRVLPAHRFLSQLP